MCETGMVLSEISYLQKHLRRFMKDKRARTPMAQFPAKSFVHPEPLGTVLIISPWNYPFQLCLEPLAGAIAAGNCAIVKPSKETPRTGQIIQTILQECFEETYIKAVLGSREETNQLLDLPFDFLFFTGSPAVGRLVMQKAAEHLTPVCLELGGKSPCIVDKTADISLAAKRIVFGKLLNAGQTCVAPDYLLVHKEVKDAFLQAFAKEISHAFGGQTFPYPDWVHIVNQKHFARLCALIKDQPIVIGGKTDAQSLQIEPTVVLCEGLSSPLMQEEIFGPIFPLIVFEEFDQALAIGAKPAQAAGALSVFCQQGGTAVCFAADFLWGRLHQRYHHPSGNLPHALWRGGQQRYGRLPWPHQL